MWIPTFGGKQLWTDYRWLHGWRVQHSSTLKLWRLLRPNRYLEFSGSRDQVLDRFETQRSEIERGTSPPKDVVILLHGLLRTASSMNSLASAFRLNSDLLPISVSYASSRDSVEEHALALGELVQNLPGEPRLSFVGHSLGNIVLRCMIGNINRNNDANGLLRRMNRIVMLGPPNNGSSFAKKLSELKLFEIVTGRSGSLLGPSWQSLETKLAVPACPFGIIAGDITQSQWRLPNPFLEGPSDWVVTVAETRLEAASELLILPCLHSFLMTNAQAVDASVRFICTGRFTSHST